MAIRCTKCGTTLMEGERFCPNCGENAPQIPEGVTPSYQQTSYNQYGQGGYNAPAAPAPAPNYGNTYNNTYTPPAQPAYEEMSLGKWVGTIVVTTFFGLISLIFLFVWGFGSGPKSRQNYCKAMLIVQLISVGLSVVLFLIMIPMLVGYIEAAEHSGYYSSLTAIISSIAL